MTLKIVSSFVLSETKLNWMCSYVSELFYIAQKGCVRITLLITCSRTLQRAFQRFGGVLLQMIQQFQSSSSIQYDLQSQIAVQSSDKPGEFYEMM